MDDIFQLTISEAKQAIERGKSIEAALNGLPAMNDAAGCSEPSASLVGKYVIVRCRDAGVHSGVLEVTNGRACALTDSRRLWRWRVPLGKSDFLSGVALYGLSDDCKIGEAVPRICLTENCEIIECTSVAEKSIREFQTCTRIK